MMNLVRLLHQAGRTAMRQRPSLGEQMGGRQSREPSANYMVERGNSEAASALEDEDWKESPTRLRA